MPRIAFVFPGQGAEGPGMADVWTGTPHRDVFDLVGERMGRDLAAIANDAETCAASTQLAQPAIYAASLAAFDALMAADVFPSVLAGHSLGEVTAAVAAGVLSRHDGTDLVIARAQAMGRACAASPGRMAAILKLDPWAVQKLADRVPDACVANVNTPAHTVVAGPQQAVDRVIGLAQKNGGRGKYLRVEGAFHSAAMSPALVRINTLLRRVDVADPTVPIVSGIDGLARSRSDSVSQALVDGVLAPVRWIDVQHCLAADGVDLLIEIGPGGMLRGFAKRTIPHLPCLSVAGPDDVQAVLNRIAELPSRTSRA